MLSLGQKLRRTRLEKGLEITAVAARTKISARFLEAIETDRRDLLPAGFFFRNWTVQYARALSLDEAEINAEVDRILSVEAPLPLPGQVTLESKEGPSWLPKLPGSDRAPRLLVSLSSLVVVVLACSGFYAWWHKAKEAGGNFAASNAAAVTKSAAVVKSPPASLGQAREQRLDQSVGGAPMPNYASAQTNDALLLELHAREQTWLVISPDGKQIFNGVLQANESKRVEARESARIKVGNAGGLDVSLNGKPVGELGPRGKVRLLLVSPDGVRIVQSRGTGEPVYSPIAAIMRSESAFDAGAALRLTLQ